MEEEEISLYQQLVQQQVHSLSRVSRFSSFCVWIWNPRRNPWYTKMTDSGPTQLGLYMIYLFCNQINKMAHTSAQTQSQQSRASHVSEHASKQQQRWSQEHLLFFTSVVNSRHTMKRNFPFWSCELFNIFFSDVSSLQVRKGLLRTGGGSSSQILRSGGITGHRR
jgi:hypothetical protein